MKAVSKDITASLRGQTSPGRGPEMIETSTVKSKPSMTVPGTGGVEDQPAPRHERSAAHYVDPMKNIGS